MNNKYEILEAKDVDIFELTKFIAYDCPIVNQKFGNLYEIKNVNLYTMIEKGIFLVGFVNGKIRGIHLSWLQPHIFDKSKIVLQQQIFFVLPESGRLSYHLFNKFIDIGKASAHHIITNIAEPTNIKSETLEKYGFKEVEKMFRMEIDK